MPALCSPDRFDKIFANHKPAQKQRRVRGSRDKRSRTIGTPQLRRDDMDPMVSQADGQTYDSKSAYYSHLKRDGYEIVEEIPDKPVIDDSPVVTTKDVKDAFEQSCAELNK